MHYRNLNTFEQICVVCLSVVRKFAAAVAAHVATDEEKNMGVLTCIHNVCTKAINPPILIL